MLHDINMVLLTKNHRSARLTLQASNAPNITEIFGDNKKLIIQFGFRQFGYPEKNSVFDSLFIHFSLEKL